MLHPLAALLAALVTAAAGTATTLRDRTLLPRALAYLATPSGTTDAEDEDPVPPLAPPPAVALLALAAAAVGLAALGTGASWLLPAYAWLAVAGVALGIVDVAQHRLPNRIVYPSYLAGLVLLAVAALARGEWSAYARALVAMAALLVVFLLLALAAPNALGLGDVKLAGLLGLYLGYLGGGQLALGFVAGVVFGAVAALLLLAARRAGWRTEFAYGPALLAGALLAVAVGRPLWDAYARAAGLR